jgi:hypothetical protein
MVAPLGWSVGVGVGVDDGAGVDERLGVGEGDTLVGTTAGADAGLVGEVCGTGTGLRLTGFLLAVEAASGR